MRRKSIIVFLVTITLLFFCLESKAQDDCGCKPYDGKVRDENGKKIKLKPEAITLCDFINAIGTKRNLRNLKHFGKSVLDIKEYGNSEDREFSDILIDPDFERGTRFKGPAPLTWNTAMAYLSLGTPSKNYNKVEEYYKKAVEKQKYYNEIIIKKDHKGLLEEESSSPLDVRLLFYSKNRGRNYETSDYACFNRVGEWLEIIKSKIYEKSTVPNQEIEDLRRENKELEEEKDNLKKELDDIKQKHEVENEEEKEPETNKDSPTKYIDIKIPMDNLEGLVKVNSRKIDTVNYLLKELVPEKKISIYFNLNSDELIEPEISKINLFYSNEFQNCRDCRIVLAGYTDSSGATDYNMKLSERRAKRVQALLLNKGVSISKIEIQNFGQLAVKPERKVDVFIVPKPKKP